MMSVHYYSATKIRIQKDSVSKIDKVSLWEKELVFIQ